MPVHYAYTLHANRALWPEHKPLDEVLELQRITPERIFSATWQGMPAPEGGLVFLREWWEMPGRRWDAADLNSTTGPAVVGRWISVDSAYKDRDESDWTALLVFELLADYRGRVRALRREKLTFPNLPGAIRGLAMQWHSDGLLRGVLIEDRGSGTSAIQTLQQSEDQWLRRLITPFTPTTSKELRAQQAALWCQAGCVQLPTPGDHAPWLIELQAELFQFPSAEHDDCVDAFSQIVLYLEHLLSEGYRYRSGAK